MKILSTIKNRRSIRKFKQKPVAKRKIMKILEAGRWAPSGYNNQPWRFLIVKNRKILDKIAELTNKFDEKTIKRSVAGIFVYAEKRAVYNDDQDNFAIGACIQNMLLEACEQGLGACWICGVLRNKDKISKILRVSNKFEMKTLIALGYSDEKLKVPRKDLKKLIIKEI
jgi:nitroreductase